MTTAPYSSQFALPVSSVEEVEATREPGHAGITGSDIDQVLTAIESVRQRILPHDYAAIALRDQTTGHLGWRVLSPQRVSGGEHVALLPTERTPAGWVLIHQKPLLASTINRRHFYKPFEGLPVGMSFGCWI